MMMIMLVVAMIEGSTALQSEPCPIFTLDELRPSQGAEFLYVQRRGGELTGRALHIAVTESRPEQVQVDVSFRAQFGASPSRPYRTHAGIILFEESLISGGAAREINVSPLTPETLSRELSTGDELRIPVRESFRTDSGDMLQHSGDYVIRHTGCGTLSGDEGIIVTRKIELESFAYAVDGNGQTTLTRLSQVHDIPVGSNWYYSQYRTGDDPMENGLLREGYEAH